MRILFNKYKNLISIALFIISIILLSGSLILKIFNKIDNINPLVTIIGCACTTFGFMITLTDNNDGHKRGFEPVVENKRKNKYYHLPTRGTKNSAGYDFYSPDEYTVRPNEIVKIWTDVKAYMQSDEFLMLDVRSSMGGKFMLANTIGIIDSDYYGNVDNDGNICFVLKNISEQTQIIKKESRFGQGIFMNYLKTDKDNFISETRKGGHGSTNEN